MNTKNEVTEIPTGGHGILRVWESSIAGWCWATPNGSEGTLVPTFDQAVSEAFEAEGLNSEDYGYSK